MLNWKENPSGVTSIHSRPTLASSHIPILPHIPTSSCSNPIEPIIDLAAVHSCPACSLCGGEPKYSITRRSNRSGNAKRPYYKCVTCEKFITFDDDRGTAVMNPLCDCHSSSRMQVAGRLAKTARGLHYVSAKGKCDFFERARSSAGVQYKLDEDLVGMFCQLGIIRLLVMLQDTSDGCLRPCNFPPHSRILKSSVLSISKSWLFPNLVHV